MGRRGAGCPVMSSAPPRQSQSQRHARTWRGKDMEVLQSAGSDFSLAFYQRAVTLAKLWKLP